VSIDSGFRKGCLLILAALALADIGCARLGRTLGRNNRSQFFDEYYAKRAAAQEEIDLFGHPKGNYP
jgi:hypothetical protein